MFIECTYANGEHGTFNTEGICTIDKNTKNSTEICYEPSIFIIVTEPSYEEIIAKINQEKEMEHAFIEYTIDKTLHKIEACIVNALRTAAFYGTKPMDNGYNEPSTPSFNFTIPKTMFNTDEKE